MGKYSNFDKVDKDFYPTIDPACMTPMFINLNRKSTYAEPCYGNGDLEDMLMETAHCVWRSDIRKTVGCSKVQDALSITESDLIDADKIITNPPYTRRDLLPMIDHFLTLKDTWLLLPADFMHNKYFSPYVGKCRLILSVGRMYWQDNKSPATNCSNSEIGRKPCCSA